MGMTASYRRITDSELKQFLDDPQFALSFVGLLVDDPFEFYQRLEAEGKRLDIQKDWQALHFLLTGEVADPGESEAPLPLRNAVMGGTDTDCEATYGVVRYLTVQEVREVADALGMVSEDDLKARYDSDEFVEAELYANTERDDDNLRALLNVHSDVAGFFKKAAEAGDAVLLSLD